MIKRLLECHKGNTYCKWGRFDHANPWQHLRYRILAGCERVADKPRIYRLSLADYLCRTAARLRRDKTVALYYARGNEAAALAEGLRFTLLGLYPLTIEQEEAQEMIETVDKLEATARGIAWVE